MILANRLIGQNDYNKVISSDWTLSGQIGDNGAVSVVFGNDATYGECFYCCDNYGNQFKSTDGITWTATRGYDSSMYEHGRVFCLNNRFFCFMTSRTLDKVHFNYTPYASVDLPDSANCTVDGACYFNNKYFIAGTQYTSGVYKGFVRYSSNLVNWSDPVYLDTNSNYIESMTCNDNTIVITSDFNVYTSTDGNTFTKTMSSPYRYPQVIYALGRFILAEIMEGGATFRLYQSFDGYEWSLVNTTFDVNGVFGGISYGLNRVVIGISRPYLSGSVAVFYDSMNINTSWNIKILSTMNGVDDIAYGNGRFVAVNGNSPYTNVCAYKLWGIE